MFGATKKQEPAADPRIQSVLYILMTVLTTADNMEARLSGRDDF